MHSSLNVSRVYFQIIIPIKHRPRENILHQFHAHPVSPIIHIIPFVSVVLISTAMKALPSSICWHHSNQNKYSPAQPISSCGQGISAFAAVSVMCCMCKNALVALPPGKIGCFEFSRIKLLRMIGVRVISRVSLSYTFFPRNLSLAARTNIIRKLGRFIGGSE